LQIFLNLFFFVGLLTLAISIKFLLSEVKRLDKEALQDYITHKGDALNLQSQVRSIDPNILVDGKRPFPIRPAPRQLREDSK
jgi:hypothetical protein